MNELEKKLMGAYPIPDPKTFAYTEKDFVVEEDGSYRFSYKGDMYFARKKGNQIFVDEVGISYSSTHYRIIIFPEDPGHLCGLNGFGQTLNDRCDACVLKDRRVNVLKYVKKFFNT